MKPKILVVDDDFTFRQVISAGLEAEGYEVLQETSGRRVIDILTEQHIALVILDIYMEDTEGMETINNIRRNFPDLPVIMISSDILFLNMARELGANETLLKPIDLKILIPMIKKLV